MEELILQAEQLRDSNPQQAIILYEQADELDPTRFWPGFWEALMTKWHVNNRESVELFKELLERFPDSDLVRIELAQNLFEIQEYEESIFYAQQVEDPELVDRAGGLLRDIENPSFRVTGVAHTFRPDNENSYSIAASSLWRVPGVDADFSVTLSDKWWPDQNNVDVTTALFDVSKDRTLLRVGATLLDNTVFPRVGIEHLVVRNEGGNNLRLRYEYKINDSDPEAVIEEIEQHILGFQYWRDGVYIGTDFQINSDDILVTESFAEVRLTRDNFLALVGYLRTASDDSDFYWTPNTFANVGIRFGFPVGDNCNVGIAPGFSYEDENDGQDVDFTLPFGAQCGLGNTNIGVRVDYGATFEITHDF